MQPLVPISLLSRSHVKPNPESRVQATAFLLDADRRCIWASDQGSFDLAIHSPELPEDVPVISFFKTRDDGPLPGTFLVTIAKLPNPCGEAAMVGAIRSVDCDICIGAPTWLERQADALKVIAPWTAIVVLGLALAADWAFDLWTHWDLVQSIAMHAGRR